MHYIAAFESSGSFGRPAILLFFLWLAATACLGQEYRATITGIVADSSKAVVANATITLFAGTLGTRLQSGPIGEDRSHHSPIEPALKAAVKAAAEA
jgi:hypothetical protein